jgi:DNA invertase Pin-like site-specific DNA recombinase
MTTSKGTQAAIYIRISTVDHNPDLQRQELPAYCQRRGWTVVEAYEDRMSGGKDRRPNLDRLMADARRRGLGSGLHRLPVGDAGWISSSP